MSTAKFLLWNAPGERWQLVEGVPTAMAPGEIGAELLQRQSDGAWPEQAIAIVEGPLTLESIGFTCGLAALYRGTRLADTNPA